MSKLKFCKEDIDKLKDNPYILNISEKAIIYTDEFKEKYMDYYNTERYQWDLAKLSPNEYYEYLITGVYPLKNDNRNN